MVPGSAAIEAALAIAGAPSRIVETATWEQNDAYAELLKCNPLGQIPTLVLPMAACFRKARQSSFTSALRIPDSSLIARDESARAQAIRGLVFIAANCYAAIGVLDYPERFCEDADEATQKAHSQRHAGTAAPLLGNVRRSFSGANRFSLEARSARSTSTPPSCRNGRDRARICVRHVRSSTTRCYASKRIRRSRRYSRSTGPEK
jgi:hypothetical protein